jgi:hypothetical protein
MLTRFDEVNIGKVEAGQLFAQIRPLVETLRATRLVEESKWSINLVINVGRGAGPIKKRTKGELQLGQTQWHILAH